MIIPPRFKDLDGFQVNRALPYAKRRTVGPFIFFDEMGPVDFAPGKGIEVRPHPHIGLATVTYLFEGTILHRDSLGSVQDITPGAVNWMVAGRGIVHSERTPDALKVSGQRLHGIQTWIALPSAREEDAPDFVHHPADALPEIRRDGATLRLIAGSAFGETAPLVTASPTLYVDILLEPGASVTLPDAARERGLYLAIGAASLDGEPISRADFLVLTPGAEPVLNAGGEGARLVLIGGDPVDAPRTIWWNFVSSRPERIEQAKADWQAGRFAPVPGEMEFIPLPE